MLSFSEFRAIDDMLYQIKAIKPYPSHSKIQIVLAKNPCLAFTKINKTLTGEFTNCVREFLSRDLRDVPTKITDLT